VAERLAARVEHHRRSSPGLSSRSVFSSMFVKTSTALVGVPSVARRSVIGAKNAR
jgi:hypothetical protein